MVGMMSDEVPHEKTVLALPYFTLDGLEDLELHGVEHENTDLSEHDLQKVEKEARTL